MARRQKHIVLRDAGAAPTAEPSAPKGARFRMGPTAAVLQIPPEPRVDTEELDAREVAILSRDRDVVSVAPSMPTRLVEPLPATAAAGTAWGVTAVRADISPFSGQGVRAAVLDTGIDATHPAFQGVNVRQADFSGEGNGDVNGHGTHCAGTILGRDVGGVRIGVAPGITEVLIGKVLKGDGRGDGGRPVVGVPPGPTWSRYGRGRDRSTGSDGAHGRACRRSGSRRPRSRSGYGTLGSPRKERGNEA